MPFLCLLSSSCEAQSQCSELGIQVVGQLRVISLVLEADWSVSSVVIDSQSTKLVNCDWP